MLAQSTSLSSSLSNERIIPSQRFINFSRDPFRGFLAPIRAIIIHFHDLSRYLHDTITICARIYSSAMSPSNKSETRDPNISNRWERKNRNYWKVFPFPPSLFLEKVTVVNSKFRIEDRERKCDKKVYNSNPLIIILILKSGTITSNKFSKFSRKERK